MRELSVLPEIEIFDPSHIHGARRLVDSGLINERLHVQFVMGVKNGLPAGASGHPIVELKNAYFQKRPGPLWGSDVINPRSWTGCWHVVGMEIGPGLKLNVRITKERPASNNAELVKIVADICAKHNARPASPAEVASWNCGLARCAFTVIATMR